MQFEWNPVKAEDNRRKHGVSFEEAMEVFSDPRRIEVYDHAHSDQENRWQTVGVSGKLRLVTVFHTQTTAAGDPLIRIITARKATKAETQHYAGAQG